MNAAQLLRPRLLDDRDDLATHHRVAGGNQPLVERAFIHVRAESRHRELDHGCPPIVVRTAATMSSRCGNAACSRCLA